MKINQMAIAEKRALRSSICTAFDTRNAKFRIKDFYDVPSPMFRDTRRSSGRCEHSLKFEGKTIFQESTASISFEHTPSNQMSIEYNPTSVEIEICANSSTNATALYEIALANMRYIYGVDETIDVNLPPKWLHRIYMSVLRGTHEQVKVMNGRLKVTDSIRIDIHEHPDFVDSIFVDITKPKESTEDYVCSDADVRVSINVLDIWVDITFYAGDINDIPFLAAQAALDATKNNFGKHCLVKVPNQYKYCGEGNARYSEFSINVGLTPKAAEEVAAKEVGFPNKTDRYVRSTLTDKLEDENEDESIYL